MARIACVGITVLDRIWYLADLPKEGGKYVANNYTEVGGGPAATAAVAQAQAAAGSSVNLSPQAQQTVRVEAFTQLVAQLVQQVGAGGPLAATAWPANGVPAAVLALLSSLVQQATAGQALPQQLLSAQAWPQNLLQAVLQQAGRSAPSAPAGQRAHCGWWMRAD